MTHAVCLAAGAAQTVDAARLAAGAAQLLGGLVLAPALPGLVQHWKARLQGRRGPGPWQPYRELRRLWTKSAVTVEGTSVLYRAVPAVIAASCAVAILLVPLTGNSPAFGVGHDVLVLVGLLALARFAAAAASWDTANGFSLMGASRDLVLSVFVEATLVLSMAVVALVTGTTDLGAMIAGTVGGAWATPVLLLGGVPFAIVVLAETGRQPVDNPDTHLELTMIHEGPLLEYAGRDLAYLQWAMAARHWLVLVIAAQVFLPHPAGVWWQLGTLPVALVALCALLAVAETMVAKLRVLLVPRLLAVGSLVALLGIVARLAGIA
jgi:formate hydrogenlyase subunit 4